MSTYLPEYVDILFWGCFFVGWDIFLIFAFSRYMKRRFYSDEI